MAAGGAHGRRLWHPCVRPLALRPHRHRIEHDAAPGGRRRGGHLEIVARARVHRLGARERGGSFPPAVVEVGAEAVARGRGGAAGRRRASASWPPRRSRCAPTATSLIERSSSGHRLGARS